MVDQPKLPSRRRRWRRGLSTARLAFRLVDAAARFELWLTVGVTVLGAGFIGGELLVGRHLVDLLVNGAGVTARDLTPWLVALGGLLVGTALVNALVGELRVLMQDLVHRQAMAQVLEASTAAELEAFDDPTFHDRVQRAREHADTYAWQVVWGMVTLSTTFLSAVAVGGVLLSVAPLLIPVSLLAFIPISIVSVMNTRSLYRMHYDLAETDRDRLYHERLLTGRLEAKEVRAFGLADYLRLRHDELFGERIRRTRLVMRKRIWLALAGSSVTALVLVTTLAMVMLLALHGHISVADAAVAVVALQQLAGRLRGIGDALTSMVEGVTFLRDFESFRSLVPVGPASNSAPPASLHSVTLDHVGYRYPAGSHDAVADVSLHLEPGRAVAIVGPNGSGKSTLAKLLCGLLSPTHGTIRWNDTDLGSCDPASIRARVAPVFQDFTRFEHSAREAIGFGDIHRVNDLPAVVAAAKRAGASSFIESLPDGYETRLSTSFAGGAELSVGQWQRVAIARAFFRNAPLVVMDEPGASLDPHAERDLFDRLHALGRDRTVVFVSHRFATVRRADLILLMLEGRVAEQGTHDELMALGGVYAELYTLQAEQFR